MSTPTEGDRRLRDLLLTLQQLDKHFAEQRGVNVTDLIILRVLTDAKTPLVIGALAQIVGLTSGAMTTAVDRLERARLVKRTPSPTDRRAILIAPARSEARKMLASMSAMNQRRAEMWGEFSPAEQAVIVRFLDRNVEIARTDASAKQPSPR